MLTKSIRIETDGKCFTKSYCHHQIVQKLPANALKMAVFKTEKIQFGEKTSQTIAVTYVQNWCFRFKFDGRIMKNMPKFINNAESYINSDKTS